MNLLPKASGTRPRVACDISTQGVVAARSAVAGGPLGAVARAELAEGAVVPGLKPGNVADRVAVAAAVRKTLEEVGMKANSRDADITLVIPDAAVRVLLLEFDALPNKLSEALPIVRFRLKKLLPFEADDAMVTFQVMSTSKSIVRVLAVAIPRDVLAEYETAAREAGYEPGSVLPSTLAALAGIDAEEAALLVNANVMGVTAAIVRGGILMLHRTVDLQPEPAGMPANLPPAMVERTAGLMPIDEFARLPLVDVHESQAEWAAQEALPEHGRDPYADRMADEMAVQDEKGITELPVPPVFASDTPVREEPSFSNEQPAGLGEEIAQAVSVAVAYFEDTLAVAPTQILSAGPLGAGELNRILTQYGLAQADGLRAKEVVSTDAIATDAVSAAVPRGWLSGVVGALRG